MISGETGPGPSHEREEVQVVRKASAAMLLVLGVLLASGVQVGVCAPPDIPKFPLPVVMTSPGLSPEIAIVKMLFDKAKIPVKSDPLLVPSQLGDAKTLVIIIGGSGKGLGAAGIDLEEEVDRAQRLLSLARERKLKVLGIHVGGEARRGRTHRSS